MPSRSRKSQKSRSENPEPQFKKNRSRGRNRGSSQNRPNSNNRSNNRSENHRARAPRPEETAESRAHAREKGREDAALEKELLALLARGPLDATGMANQLQLTGNQRARLKRQLAVWEKEGKIARIRRDRYILPNEVDLFTGEIQFHASGAAHVLSREKGQPDLFISPENTATALHGDIVVARISPPRSGEERPDARPGRREGRVIRILERRHDRIVGTLQRTPNFYYVVADDPRFVNNLYVPAPEPPLQAKPGDKVVAKLDEWTSRHINPEGHIIEVLGPANAPGVDMLSIIRKYRLPEKFPAKVLQEAAEIGSRDPAREAEKQGASRVDCRGDFVFTIDPDDARDFDDAIHVERTNHGWKVGIHIADVSHYVRPKSALDREAFARGNSVYLPDRVIPMLPEVLSNGLCSLRPNEDRLAFSVFAEVSPEGKVRHTRFAKSIIRSRHRLTYKEALAMLQSEPTDEISRRVHEAWAVSSRLRRRRFENGSLDLDFPETKVRVDENGKPYAIEKIENDISHQLIEELMLLANESVARELKLRRQPTVYRVHENPDPDKLLEFRDLARSFGISCGDLTQRQELQRLLASVRGQSFEYTVKVGLLKSLKRARYSDEALGHYGLAKSDYLHFTSPIRRYADLIAHRSLEKHLGLTKQGPDSRQLAEEAEHISTTERNAADAEREAVKLKKLEFFAAQIADRKGDVFSSRILEVRNFGLFVELPDLLVSGLVHVSALDSDFFTFDPVRQRFTGRKTKQVYEAGMTMEVMVSRVDLFKQQIDFRPAPPEQPKTSGKPKESTAGAARRKSRRRRS